MSPRVIGRYEIKHKLGRGGMATVYLAFDPRFKRDVAIKVLPHDLMLDQKFRGRFEREATIIANLNHPAVVSVFDYGEQDDQPYLVMQLMSGGTLVEQIAQGPMPGPVCQEIVRRIASALDRAHAKGVIHRDLKPANILFDEFNEAFLADFGIAKMVESSSTLTGSGLIGTPAYMSPEQVNSEPAGIQSDIYSLGVIAFEMLTGQQPFYADTPMQTIVNIVSRPSPNILEYNPALPQACELAIAQALSKVPEERYSTAGEFAEIFSQIEFPDFSLEDFQTEEIPHLPTPPPTPQPIDRPFTLNHRERVLCLAWSPDGKTIASGTRGRLITLWNVATQDKRTDLQGHVDWINAISWSPNGTMLASGSRMGRVILWDSVTGERIGVFKAHDSKINDLAFNPDGSLLVTASADSTLAFWDSTTWNRMGVFSEHRDRVFGLSMRPNGDYLASASADGSVMLWNIHTGEVAYYFEYDEQVASVAWSPSGTNLAAGLWDGRVVFIDLDAERSCEQHNHTHVVQGLAWSPNGEFLASSSWDRAVIVWHAADQRPLDVLTGHEGRVFDVAFSPDGQALASASRDCTVRVWPINW